MAATEIVGLQLKWNIWVSSDFCTVNRHWHIVCWVCCQLCLFSVIKSQLPHEELPSQILDLHKNDCILSCCTIFFCKSEASFLLPRMKRWIQTLSEYSCHNSWTWHTSSRPLYKIRNKMVIFFEARSLKNSGNLFLTWTFLCYWDWRHLITVISE